MSLHIHLAPDAQGTAENAMFLLEGWGALALRQRERFVVALAGGSTPETLYKCWASQGSLDWSRLVLLFGDERCVPPAHADANAGMVTRALLEPLAQSWLDEGRPALTPQLHRMHGEDPPEQAAQAYEKVMAEVLAQGPLDVALLGLGADGHTASLFPHSPALAESQRLCVAGPGPEGKGQRLTLTYPALEAAQRLVFLAVGAGKAGILRQLLRGPLDPQGLPAQRLLRPTTPGPEVHLVIDRTAAAGWLEAQ